MPLTHQSLELNKCKVAIWEITESVEELQSALSLSASQETDFTLRKTIAGKKGYLAVRNALESLEQKIATLTIAADGAPEIPGKFCSCRPTVTSMPLPPLRSNLWGSILSNIVQN